MSLHKGYATQPRFMQRYRRHSNIYDEMQWLRRYRPSSTCQSSTISLQSLNSIIDVASSTISLQKSFPCDIAFTLVVLIFMPIQCQTRYEPYMIPHERVTKPCLSVNATCVVAVSFNASFWCCSFIAPFVVMVSLNVPLGVVVSCNALPCNVATRHPLLYCYQCECPTQCHGQLWCPLVCCGQCMLAVLQGKEKMADQMRQELAGDTRSDHLMLVNAYNVSYEAPCATLHSQLNSICLVNGTIKNDQLFLLQTLRGNSYIFT